MRPRTYRILFNREAKAEHLLTWARGHFRCFCDPSLIVHKRLVHDETDPKTLQCVVCQVELNRWKDFWAKQKDLYPREDV